MLLKDPTAWMEDLTVFVDDEEITGTAALLEPDLVYSGSKAAATAYLSLMGIAGGAFAAITFSAGIRESWTSFAVYLVGALLLFKGLRPVTLRLLGRPMVWLVRTTFFWATLLASTAVFSSGAQSSWLAYGFSIGGGFFIGMMHGSLNPNCIKREEAWMSAALVLGPLSTVLGTAISRHYAAPDSIGAAAAVGGLVAGLFSAPMSGLLFLLWDEAHGFKRMAMLFLHNENFAQKAVSYIDKAIALAPADPQLWNLRGVAWSQLDKPERAAADWRKAAELRPQDPEPHLNLGVDCIRRGKYDEAIQAFDEALKRNPEDAAVHNNLGVVLERRGELDRAIVHYDKAIAIRSDYANAYSNRGHAHFRQGDHHGAIADCDQALALNPRFPMALVNRGHALSALGQHQAAAESYQAAIEMPLSPAVHEEALRCLEALASAASRKVG